MEPGESIALPSPASRALQLALVLAVAVTAGALLLRAIDVAAGAAPTGTALLPLLFTGAGLCTAGLLRRRSPAGAWLATVAAAGIAAIEVVGVIRAWQPSTTLQAWPWLVAAANAALLVAAAVAAAYATRTRPRSPSRSGFDWTTAWSLLVLAGLAAVVVAGAWAVASSLTGVALAAGATAATVDVWPLRASGRVATAFVALATIGGAWRDLAVPARRAWTRAPSLREFPRALGDELLPTSAAMRRRGEEDERARLAAELHARVLPDLRRAAEAAEAAGAPADPLAVGLRHAVDDVEQLMHARQSVVLEEYGLVAALEWLAERTQQRGSLVVDVELDGADVDDAASLPKPVQRAAFRIALLAVDNVVRHAAASRTAMHLHVEAGRLRLTVADDGRGIDLAGIRQGGRGLVDMRTAAAEVGAAITIERVSGGTRVALTWPRAEDHATAARGSADGPGAPRG